MKICKKGFSLAEVLIAVAIISIIATMGFSIAKKNIERAYDLYIYTGYKGLSDAFTDAHANGKSPYTEAFLDHAVDVLKANKNPTTTSNTAGPLTITAPITITAPNNIVYKIGPSALSVQSNNERYTVLMETPSTTKQDPNNNNIIINKNTTCFYYYYDQSTLYGLIPVQVAGFSDNTKCVSTIENIQGRIDLLPFYLDDGIQGRVTRDAQGNPKYHPKTYYSFYEAACKAFGKNDDIGFGNCNGIQKEKYVILKVEDPRKAF